jgi:hypothetical protein
VYVASLEKTAIMRYMQQLLTPAWLNTCWPNTAVTVWCCCQNKQQQQQLRQGLVAAGSAEFTQVFVLKAATSFQVLSKAHAVLTSASASASQLASSGKLELKFTGTVQLSELLVQGQGQWAWCEGGSGSADPARHSGHRHLQPHL